MTIDPIPSVVRSSIGLCLHEIEQRHRVRILFACESGSRAWGFESQDSDYDCRFVYLGEPASYHTVLPQRDVIENHELPWQTDKLKDFAGRDLRKFLALALRSNPVAFEWLNSTLVYEEAALWKRVREIVPPFYSPKAGMHHYLSMARHNYREHMRDGKSPRVRLKKYLYITRPLLCANWIAARGTPPPMPYEEVLDAVLNPTLHGPLVAELKELVRRKRAGDELDESHAAPVINGWIDGELVRLLELANAAPTGSGNVSELDRVLHDAIVGQ